MEKFLTATAAFIKWFIILVFTIYGTKCKPIHDFLFVIFVLFIVNFLFGLLEDLHRKNDFNIKKAFHSIWNMAGLMLLLFMTFGIGSKMKIEPNTVIEFTSWVTWVAIYFYAVNIFKNWSFLQPENKVISFMYWAVSVKFIDKIQFLKDFLSKNDTPNNTPPNNDNTPTT